MLNTERNVCYKCHKSIQLIDDDWNAQDGTACGGDVNQDNHGDPIIGHHEPVLDKV